MPIVRLNAGIICFSRVWLKYIQQQYAEKREGAENRLTVIAKLKLHVLRPLWPILFALVKPTITILALLPPPRDDLPQPPHMFLRDQLVPHSTQHQDRRRRWYQPDLARRVPLLMAQKSHSR